MPHFEYGSHFPLSSWELFQYHARPGAFERLFPPWERGEIIRRNKSIQNGERLEFRIRKGPLWVRWVAEHDDFTPGRRFRDTQVVGPFRKWQHTHLIEDTESGCRLLDSIDFELPLGLPGGSLMRGDLERMFAFRHQRTSDDLERFANLGNGGKVVVMLGKVTPLLQRTANILGVAGHEVYRLCFEEQRFLFRHWFSGEAAHPLDETSAIIHSGRAGKGPEEDPHGFAFLQSALLVSDTQPRLLLFLRGRHADLDVYTTDPSLDAARRHEQRNNTEEPEELADLCEHVLHLQMGTVIHPPLSHLVNDLLHLETFLFLENDARTPEFRWISAEDAAAAIHHLIHNPCSGQFALISPEPATRAQLQALVLEHDFKTYTFNRLLRVLPWAQTGLPPGMDPVLAGLPTVGEKGFICRHRSLTHAVAEELGSAW